MARSPQFELVTPSPNGPITRRMSLGNLIAAGGSGTVFGSASDPSSVTKLYHETTSAKDLADYAQRVEAMVQLRPDLDPIAHEGRSYVQIAWPTASVLKDGKFAGFSMPALEMSQTKNLEVMLLDKQARLHGLRPHLGARVTLCRQLAGVMNALHQRGHYIVDLKPPNIQFYDKTLYMAVLDCDGFSINDAGSGRRYPAPMFTQEYLAPEFQGAGRNPNTDPEAQDRFALAVIIFQLMSHGVHPFTGVLRDSSLGNETKDLIARGDFPYGRRPNPNCKPRPASTHECLPDELRSYFDRAFGPHPADRPSAHDWMSRLDAYATVSTGNLVKCRTDQEHLHFAGLPCSSCALDRLRKGAATPKPASSIPPPPPKPRKVVAAPPLTRQPSAARQAPRKAASAKNKFIGFAVFALMFVVFLAYQGNNHPSSPASVPAPPAEPLNAASFNCAKANAGSETTICKDATLSGLDRQMAAMYRDRLTSNAGERASPTTLVA